MLNLYCPTCNRPAKAPMDLREYQEQGNTYFEATCARCGAKVRLNLRELP